MAQQQNWQPPCLQRSKDTKLSILRLIQVQHPMLASHTPPSCFPSTTLYSSLLQWDRLRWDRLHWDKLIQLGYNSIFM